MVTIRLTERNVKSIAPGRRNWLFADTPDGARTCCVFDTFVATAKANHPNVYYYLKSCNSRFCGISAASLAETREKIIIAIIIYSPKDADYVPLTLNTGPVSGLHI